MLPVIYTWEIYTNDDDNIFLGYAYANDESTAIDNSLNGNGVASRYETTAQQLKAKIVQDQIKG